MNDAPAPVPVFKLSAVPAEHRDWLDKAGQQIQTLAYRTVCDYVRIGVILVEGRKRLRRKAFRQWIAAELPFGRAWAYQLMAVARAFGPFVKPDAAEVIDSRALVLLARAPVGARAFAVEQAGDGTRITLAYAREIVAAHLPQPDPEKADVREHEANMKGIRDDEKKARAAAASPAEGHARAAKAWAMMEKLASQGGVVTVTTVGDDGDDGPAPYHVLAMLPSGPCSAVCRSLADAVATVLGEEDRRLCLGKCRQEKPLSEFGENRLKRGGKNPYCKVCERARLGKIKKAAKAARRSAGA